MNLRNDKDAAVLQGRTIQTVHTQQSANAEAGWPVLHFTDGSRLIISGCDYDVDLSLREPCAYGDPAGPCQDGDVCH